MAPFKSETWEIFSPFMPAKSGMAEPLIGPGQILTRINALPFTILAYSYNPKPHHSPMQLMMGHSKTDVQDLPELIDFAPDKIPAYAILSHRWNSAPSEEVLFADLVQHDTSSTESLRRKQGYQKLQSSCAITREHELNYLWVDTCCIDKSSSAELSEAINSMYAWYKEAEICFGYLEDVSSTVDVTSHNSELTRTEWATRGWTLQELLAPSVMVFYSREWRSIGTKDSLSGILSFITGVDEQYLTERKSLWTASIAKRMSWAARRKTSRPEDIAYCLMGMFQVNMPMLYGEGEKNAFIRLQEEIMKHSDDHSLFAWTIKDEDETALHGLLADKPSYFDQSYSIISYEDHEDRAPFSMSNRGLCIELHLTTLGQWQGALYAAALDCPVPPNFEDSSFLAVYLKKLPGSNGQYARVKAGAFGELRGRGKLQTIYVRQSIIVPDIEGIYPTHIFQLRRFISHDPRYRVSRTIRRDGSVKSSDTPPAVKTTQSNAWIPENNPSLCRIKSKADTRSHFAIQLEFDEMESIVILLGTSNMEVGFSLINTPFINLTHEDSQNLFRTEFQPVGSGSSLVLGYHRVCVTAEVRIVHNYKYYLIDIQVDPLPRPRNLVEEALDAFEGFVLPDSRLPVEHKRTVMERLRRPFGVRRVE